MTVVDYKMRLIAGYVHGEVLDIGCAESPNPYLINPTGLDIVKIQKPKNYRSVWQADLNKINEIGPEKGFDTLIASDVIEHIDNPIKFLRQCNRSLADGGILIITCFNANYFWHFLESLFNRRPDHEHIYIWSKAVMRYDIELAGFKILQTHGISFELPHTKFCMTSPWTTFAKEMVFICKKVNEPRHYEMYGENKMNKKEVLKNDVLRLQ